MDQKQMLKQMIDFNKATFENAFTTMIMVQDQVEKSTSMLLEQATWLPKEGRKAIDDWVKAYKKGRESFKNTVDESFKNVEKFFAAADKG
ncbi:MAG: hypothetical protein WCA08_13515 [Desulfoferrobacter sp.]